MGTLWDLNIGQVYNTLRLLERDGLAELQREEKEGRGPARRIYRITVEGKTELSRWLAEPVRKLRRFKDEFYVKLVFTQLAGEDVQVRICNQRQVYLQALRQVNDLRAALDADAEPLTEVLLEGSALHLEADLAWLDRCEALLGHE